MNEADMSSVYANPPEAGRLFEYRSHGANTQIHQSVQELY